jgi:hypothetical protein
MTDPSFTPPAIVYPDNTMFNWDHKNQICPTLWQLENFLNDEWLTKIKNDYRRTESLWSSRYPNRLVMENNHWLNAILFGSALIPYLEELTGENLGLATCRGYLDLSGANFYPHFDSSQWVVNVQIYLSDVDMPELGTQFVLDNDINSTVTEGFDEQGNSLPVDVEDHEYYTVPFRKNWGYINDNRYRKLHKTRLVPPGFARESLHLNYGLRQGSQTGLEGVAEWATTGQTKVLENWHAANQQLNTVDGLRAWLVTNSNYHKDV